MDRQKVFELLPFLETARADFKEAFFEKSHFVTVPGGHVICLERNQCMHLPIVISGTARVYKASDEGKELTLYRIESGESCILTASCIINQVVFPANAVAMSDIEALVVSPHDVRDWMRRYPDWRDYIFDLLSRRLASVIELVEEVAFQRMDARLSAYLQDLSAGAPVIKKTHEAIATELGTSREVISRLLKELEHNGVVQLSRGQIEVVDRPKLLEARAF